MLLFFLRREAVSPTRLPVPCVLEGNFYLGPIGRHLAIADDQVQLNDLGHPQIAQVFASADGLVIGTHLREDNVAWKPFDRHKVEKFMKVAERYR